MKKFILFAGDCYYPGGGTYDFVGMFKTKKEALLHAALLNYDKYNSHWFEVAKITNDKLILIQRGKIKELKEKQLPFL